ADRQVIQSYSTVGFKVSGKMFQGSVIVFPDRALPWQVDSVYDLKLADFAVFDKKDIDFLIVGCGAKAERMELPIIHAIQTRGILLETMETGAACRTYNALLADGRRIAAALIPAEKPL